MKKLAIGLLLITAVLTVAACKTKPQDTNGGTSSVPAVKSEIESTVISEGDFFTQNGTESEFRITESQALELFETQASLDKESAESTASDKEDSSSEADSGTAESSQDSNSSGAASDQTESKTDSSKPTASTSKYDKDGDGWTDGWK